MTDELIWKYKYINWLINSYTNYHIDMYVINVCVYL